ncbi:MAG: hypothetical protein GY732_23895, partial [Gammaproteobacteria bacterium]|nr:hypothetical protein [Gammaproteobacteria bacterium]
DARFPGILGAVGEQPQSCEYAAAWFHTIVVDCDPIVPVAWSVGKINLNILAGRDGRFLYAHRRHCIPIMIAATRCEHARGHADADQGTQTTLNTFKPC